MRLSNQDDQPTEAMQQEAERIAKEIYDGTLTVGTIDPALTKLVAEKLRDAVVEGFGIDLSAIDYDTPDYNMLLQLEKNVFQFAGAKNYQQLKSTSLALRDENGVVRSFDDFKEQALKINSEYNGRFLQTEYDTAIGSGQMAGKWVGFEDNKATAPLLRYDTAHDDRVRPAHAALDGVIKEVDDPFWNLYYPPNGWNCRCDVTQILNGTPTPSHEIEHPDDIPPMFKTNLAKSGLVFPKNHPYYDGVPQHILDQAEQLRKNAKQSKNN